MSWANFVHVIRFSFTELPAGSHSMLPLLTKSVPELPRVGLDLDLHVPVQDKLRAQPCLAIDQVDGAFSLGWLLAVRAITRSEANGAVGPWITTGARQDLANVTNALERP